jgi:hypothetical protein
MFVVERRVSVPLADPEPFIVPIIGSFNTGLIENTNEPLPVSSGIKPASCAEVVDAN